MRSQERRWRARGKLASAADEMSEWRGGVDSVLRERNSRYVHIRATPSFLLPLFPAPGTASMIAKPPPSVSVTTESLNLMHLAAAVQILPVVTHQVHISDSFHKGCFQHSFPCDHRGVSVRGTHTSITSVTDLDRIYCSLCEAVLLPT